ncbi:MAG: cytochrome c family protein [Chloroflexi bacterium OLB14]|nr:MAG: cytochrome c family protein [Chloroflexi bacterium OLB14]
MLKNIFDWLKQPLGLIAVGIFFLSVFSVALYGISTTQQAPAQPIEFPHKTHVGFGIQCLYCHPGASKGPAAGIPSQAKCWACHNQIEKTQTSELLAPLKNAVLSGESIQWVPVAIVPDFVQFNHRPHIAAGKNCEECHGDMSQVTIAENPQVFNMGWCLDCHLKNAGDDVEKKTKLTDCGTCHY